MLKIKNYKLANWLMVKVYRFSINIFITTPPAK